MAANIVIPSIAPGDNQINSINANFGIVAAGLNSIDGAKIAAATIPNAAIAKPKVLMPFVLNFNNLSALATGTNVWHFKLPNIDGAINNTWRFVSYSIKGRVLTSPAGNTLEPRKNNTGASMLAAPINLAALTADVPVTASPAAPVACASGDLINVVYTKSGAPTLTDIDLILFFSVELAGS